MKIIIKFINLLLDSIKYSVHDMIIFPGKNLLNSIKWSLAIALISFVLWAFHIPTLMDWRGASLGTLVLIIVYLINRKE